MRIIFKNKKNKKTLVGEKKLYQIQKFLYNLLKKQYHKNF